MSALTFLERPASGHAEGLLVLHHGRGTSELDLLPLAAILVGAGLLPLALGPRRPARHSGTPERDPLRG